MTIRQIVIIPIMAFITTNRLGRTQVDPRHCSATARGLPPSPVIRQRLLKSY
jgi:hypothetical protein